MLTKAYSNHFDIAVLLAGDEDFLEVVNSVKNTGKLVYGAFFANHVSIGLKESFDKRLSLTKEWMNKIRSTYDVSWMC
jgi:uncharacterized LabA/DUF88 family protein